MLLSQGGWLWVLYKLVICCERNTKVLFPSQDNKKGGWQGWILHFNFIFSLLHHPESQVHLVYWIHMTASAIHLVILIFHCILLIIEVLILVTNSQTACADGLCLMYFTSLNKHLLHLVTITYSLCYTLRRAWMGNRSSKKCKGHAWLSCCPFQWVQRCSQHYAEHLAKKPQGLEQSQLYYLVPIFIYVEMLRLWSTYLLLKYYTVWSLHILFAATWNK